MKNPFENVAAMAARMTPRERQLFAILVGALLCAVVVVAYLMSAAVFGGIQEDIDHGRQVLAEVRQLAPRYQDLAESKRAIDEAIRNNRQSVRVAANEILKKMDLIDEVAGATGGKLSDIVSFEGKTTDTPLDTLRGKTKKPAKGKKDSAGVLQVEQNLEFREVPVDNLVAFLDSIEASKDLLFVTKIDAARKFNKLDHVRAVVTIATFVNESEGAAAGEGGATGGGAGEE